MELRTDLAVEAREIAGEDVGAELHLGWDYGIPYSILR